MWKNEASIPVRRSCRPLKPTRSVLRPYSLVSGARDEGEPQSPSTVFAFARFGRDDRFEIPMAGFKSPLLPKTGRRGQPAL